MAQLTAKELSAINELLAGESHLGKKFQLLADSTTNTELKAKFTDISNKHQQHFNTVYEHLK